MSLRVLSPGFVTTVQDLGRASARLGVPRGGAMDSFAHCAANLLVGNPIDAAALEFTLDAPVLLAESDCLVAFGGRGFQMKVSNTAYPAWMAVLARCGERIQFEPDGSSGWGILAVSGGLDVPVVLGSRSTYLRGGFGGVQGRALMSGDRLQLGSRARDLSINAGICLPDVCLPDYSEKPNVRVIVGPQWEAFTEAGQATFLTEAYQLTNTADRMGYRFSGAPIQHNAGADIVSDGLVVGAVQVPADGLPIVMMSDCQTAGGYTKIGVVITADLPLVAQCPPGVGSLLFQQVSVAAAQHAYRAQMKRLVAGIAANQENQLASSRF